MREFLKVTDEQKILYVLKDFNDVFPHLHEKIDDLESFAKKLSRYSNFYISKKNGKNVGMLVFYSNNKAEKTAYLSLIGVKESIQGTGLGKKLLILCEQKSKCDGMNKLYLEVDLDNKSAISFYQRNGFVFGEKTDRNSIYMYKTLN